MRPPASKIRYLSVFLADDSIAGDVPPLSCFKKIRFTHFKGLKKAGDVCPLSIAGVHIVKFFDPGMCSPVCR
jgi:hypothetical protein